MQYRLLPFLTAFFVTCLIVSNLVAIKPLAIGPFIMPAAMIIFPLSYILGDVLTEVYGYRCARRVIWIGFSCNLLSAAVIALSIGAAPASFWTLGAFDSAPRAQEAYAAVFGLVPRILVASFAAYLVGEFLNAYVLAKLKIAMRGRRLWVRTISSTLVGQLADSAIFITAAFYGLFPTPALAAMILTQWLAKSLYEAALTPLTYLAVGYLKKTERLDVYDHETDFNPFARR
jgi:hypothetical protein